ncbi:alternative sulfate transporter [Diaporthe eres]|nr:alternative sulfate transporter [Diaporthe eres]
MPASSDEHMTSGLVHQPDEKAMAYATQPDWTLQEEAKAKRKLDLHVVSVLTLGFFCLQLDRGNIANAITDNFMEDVGIDQNQFKVGQQLLSLGIVLFEIPSNMILYRVGPGKWLTLQLFLFGLPRTYGILYMRGVGGKPGWFWLFALMGIFTIFVGCLFGLVFPDSFKKPYCPFAPGRQVFTDRELYILNTRVILDDPLKGHKKKHIDRKAFKKAFKTNWRIIVHVAITILNNGPQRGFDTYSPSIIRSFGFEGLTSNALASVGLFLQIPVSFSFSYVSDHFNKRGPTVIAGVGCHLLGYVMNRIFTEMPENMRGIKYFGVIWTQMYGTFPQPLNVAWVSVTCHDSEVRALAMAIMVMAGNIAGIYGAQIFREEDNPLYRRGFNIGIAILATSCFLAIIRYIDSKLVILRQNREGLPIKRPLGPLIRQLKKS